MEVAALVVSIAALGVSIIALIVVIRSSKQESRYRTAQSFSDAADEYWEQDVRSVQESWRAMGEKIDAEEGRSNSPFPIGDPFPGRFSQSKPLPSVLGSMPTLLIDSFAPPYDTFVKEREDRRWEMFWDLRGDLSKQGILLDKDSIVGEMLDRLPFCTEDECERWFRKHRE